MFKPLLIYKGETLLDEKINASEEFNIETFDFGNSDLDTYISQEFIPTIAKKDFNILFIKDNLSDNYLELYGITLVYHIRLSSELGDKRLVPIVVLSDVDGYILNKLTPMANVLFTKNTFVDRNEILSYDYFEKVFKQIQPFSDFKTEFLDLVHIDPPQDYLSHHDISNEWSIYRWAEFLKVDTDATKSNKEKIENMLYFKYLKAKFPIAKKTGLSILPKTPQHKGNILYIDDEWDKGWKDIFEKYFKKNENITFHFINHIYKDTTYDAIETLVKESLSLNSIDTVLLDMRLTKEDHEQNDVKQLSGIKLLNLIKSFNPGIQLILLTASGKSTILDEANKYDILGYIKKEHPENYNLTTQGNINKLIRLVNKGFERKFLKNIYITKREIENVLQNDIFSQYDIKFEKYELYWKKIIVEVEAVFDILDSDRGNRFLYATVSIAVSMESILSIFVPNDREMFFWDGETYKCNHNALRCRIKELFKKLGSNEDFDMNNLIKKRNDYIHKKPVDVNQDEIKLWFSKLRKMIEIIKKPPNLKLYDKNDLASNLQNAFQNR